MHLRELDALEGSGSTRWCQGHMLVSGSFLVCLSYQSLRLPASCHPAPAPSLPPSLPHYLFLSPLHLPKLRTYIFFMSTYSSESKPKPSVHDPPPLPEDVTYSYKDSFKDWLRLCRTSDQQIELKVLSILPFFPDSDGKRTAKIINTNIDDKNYIHEFFIENKGETPLKDGVKDIVLIHGYAANLGLFFSNFDALSSIPGVRVHAIDLLGFGFSSRPNFPAFDLNTIDGVIKTEDWFIDSIEAWRKKRNIENFVLIGHSFGGYLSACYAMKYNKVIDGKNLINKMVLVSPVGVERNKYSLLSNIPNPFFDDKEIEQQNKLSKAPTVEDELLKDQQTLERNPKYKHIDFDESDEMVSRRLKLIKFMWERNVSPFSIIRALGPLRSKAVSVWTTRRFASIYLADREYYQNMHDYMYKTFSAKGSGEYSITRVLAMRALPRLPLSDRVPDFMTKYKIPTLWMYGDVDWMNSDAGEEIVKEINSVTKSNIAKFAIIPNAGHHLYLDNSLAFHSTIFKFLNFKA